MPVSRACDLKLAGPAERSGCPAADVLVVDNGVAGLEVLLAGLNPGTELHRIAPRQNPWPLLAELWSRSQQQRLHLLGHGQPGELQLGRLRLRECWLQRLTLTQRQQPWQAICFWSCSTGAGAIGRRFLQRVADLSGSAVFAASSPVGAARHGGSWSLDVCMAPTRALDRAGPGETQQLSDPIPG